MTLFVLFYNYVAFPYQGLIESTESKPSHGRTVFIHLPRPSFCWGKRAKLIC